jgi:hypothetical protein
MGCEGEQEESDHGDWRGGGERQAGLEEAWRLRNVSRDEREEPLTREVWKRVPHARGVKSSVGRLTRVKRLV